MTTEESNYFARRAQQAQERETLPAHDMETGNYLARRFQQAQERATLPAPEMELLRARLGALLARRIASYTMGDSGSVPAAVAQELFASISFTLGLYVKAQGGDLAVLLAHAELTPALEAGWAIIEAQIAAARERLRAVQASAPRWDNLSYHDTLRELEGCFSRYDYRFAAHEIPCAIDYQLCHPVPEYLRGIEYLNEYLRRLLLENQFCRCFKPDTVTLLLQSYCPDPREQLINLYEPIVTNALGLTLLDRNFFHLDISAGGRKELQALLQAQPLAQNLATLQRAGRKLGSSLRLRDSAAQEYLLATVRELYPRLEIALSHRNLENIFLSFNRPPVTRAEQSWFIDGAVKSDVRLRALIDEIRDCRRVEDKIALVKNEVRSLQDLTEVLNLCFWGEDCKALLAGMDRLELALLQKFRRRQPPEWQSDSGWERVLDDFAPGEEGEAMAPAP